MLKKPGQLLCAFLPFESVNPVADGGWGVASAIVNAPPCGGTTLEGLLHRAVPKLRHLIRRQLTPAAEHDGATVKLLPCNCTVLPYLVQTLSPESGRPLRHNLLPFVLVYEGGNSFLGLESVGNDRPGQTDLDLLSSALCRLRNATHLDFAAR